MADDRMHKWILWLGYALAAFGAALLSPLVDLLPVEFLPYLSGDFAHSGSQYLRVVSSDSGPPRFLPFSLVALGVIIIAAAWLLRRRLKSR